MKLQTLCKLALVLCVLGVFASVTHADDDNGKRSFSGTWETVLLEGGPRTLKLDQDGNEVTGKYSPGNGKVEGEVKKKVLRLRWKDDGGKGSANFILSDDGQMFSGRTNNTDDPDAHGKWWNGVRREKMDFSGAWNLALSDKENYTVLLQQNGKKVSGTFQPGNGVITDGKVRDDKLVFKYTREYFQGAAKGEGVFKLSDDGQTLSGKLDEIEGPEKGVTTGDATRAPVSFTGTWTWKSVETGADVFMETVGFHQVGNMVNQGQEGGKVIGSTLFFEWEGTNNHHNAVLVMNPDGKSFRGVFNQGGPNGARNVATIGTKVSEQPPGK